MALLQVNFFSDSLKRQVPVNVILPIENHIKDSQTHKFKTLYLLHGLTADHNDWLTYSNIRALAEQHDLAVVMPYGDNSFYVDLEIPDNNYGNYIGSELVKVTRMMFPFSEKREETFICGVSMGGFGALRNGIKYHDTFGYVVGLSAAIHFFSLPVGHPERGILFHEDAVMGDLEKAALTDKDPRVAVANLRALAEQNNSVRLPRIYMSCGLQDILLTANHLFRDCLLENGFPITYHESDGIHDWKFWNDEITKVMEWLPL